MYEFSLGVAIGVAVYMLLDLALDWIAFPRSPK